MKRFNLLILFIGSLFLTATSVFSGEIEFKNSSYPPGQKQLTAIEGGRLVDGIKVLVLKDNKPVSGEAVLFKLTHADGRDAKVENDWVLTNNEGVAQTTFQVGKKAGNYIVTAFYHGEVKVEPVGTDILALRRNWILFLFFGLLGGLSLFLFGMDLSSDGLQKAAGDKMRYILGKLTNKPLMGVVVGTLTTAAVQSSSATTVMLVGFVTASLMTLKQAIGVIFGCNIGTTITVQLIAFNISEYSTAMLAVGFLLTLFSNKKPIFKYLGKVIMGFGFIFFGMGLMSQSMNPMRSIPAFTDLLMDIGDKPFFGLVVATLFSAIIQSSGAVIGMSIALASQGILSVNSAIVISFGANIGTTVTALLASLGAEREGKRVSLVHFLFNFIGVLLFFPWIKYYANFVMQISGAMGDSSISRVIANAHMFFNIINTIVFLPFVGVLERVVRFIIPEKETDKKEVFKAQFLVGEIKSIPIALEQTFHEVARMGDITKGVIRFCENAMIHPEKEWRVDLNAETEKINILYKAIRRFLTELSANTLTPRESNEAAYYYHTIDALKHISDSVLTEFIPRMDHNTEKKATFSEEQIANLTAIMEKINFLFDKNLLSFTSRNILLAEEAGLLYKKLKFMIKKIENQAIEQTFREGGANRENLSQYIEMLEGLRALSSFVNQFCSKILENL